MQHSNKLAILCALVAVVAVASFCLAQTTIDPETNLGAQNAVNTGSGGINADSSQSNGASNAQSNAQDGASTGGSTNNGTDSGSS